MNPADESLIVRYLLGELSGKERDAFDERLISEPALVENMEAMEGQLIRDSLRGELPPDQQSQFDRYFLSFPDLQRRYELTKAFLAADDDAATLRAQPRLLTRVSSAFAALRFDPWKLAAIVATAVAAILVWQDLALRSQLGRSESAARTERAGPVLSFLLPPGLERRASTVPLELQIPAEAHAVRLQLDFELSERHSVYEALLRTVDGDRQVSGQSGLTAHPVGAFQNVTFEIPASALPPGDYTILLRAADNAANTPVETYSFRVARPAQQ